MQTLVAGDDTTGSGFTSAWKALRGALRKELEYKSVWSGKPSYVGVYGMPTWDAPDALDELLQACFTFVFVERVPQMLARFKLNGNIDGDVRLAVRNFVHGRQKDHDPLGFHLFGLLRSAVAEAIESGELFRHFGDSSIRNDTVLSSSRRVSTKPAEELAAVASGWAGDTAADLFSMGPGSRQRAVTYLRRCLVQLGTQGVSAFTFKAALDRLKSDVRAQLALCFELDHEETVVAVAEDGTKTLIPTMQPETWVEEIDSYRKLVACVNELVARHQAQERTRQHLERLWGFFRRYSVSVDEQVPTHRGLDNLLGIPRARVPDLLRVLQGLVSQCQEATSTVIDGHFRDPEPGEQT